MKEKELKHKEFDLQMAEPSNDVNTGEKLANLATRYIALLCNT